MEMTFPEISVVVPVYKVEKYLERCVQSILDQTFTEFELLLIDDGSPDRCPELCEEFAQSDGRIRVIHQKNQGLSAARNKGIESANGKYLAFIDSDDWIHPEMLERLHREIIENDAQIAVCGYSIVHEGAGTEEVEETWLKKEGLTGVGAISLIGSKSYNMAFVIACNKLYRKEVFQTVRYPVGKVNEDVFVTGDLYLQCDKICSVPEPYYYYVQREGSIMHTCNVSSLDGVEGYYLLFMRLHDLGYTEVMADIEKRLFAQLTVVYRQLSPELKKHPRVKEIKSCWKKTIRILIKEKKCTSRTLIRSFIFGCAPWFYYRIAKFF